MNVAARAGKHTPATEFLDKLTGLFAGGKFKEAAEAYKDFAKANPTSDFMVLEAVPFRIQNLFVQKIGSTPFSIYTLRHPTWTTDIVEAFEDPAKFDAYVKKLEADVTASKPAPKK